MIYCVKTRKWILLFAKINCFRAEIVLQNHSYFDIKIMRYLVVNFTIFNLVQLLLQKPRNEALINLATAFFYAKSHCVEIDYPP